jgi:outer membrane protein TolC
VRRAEQQREISVQKLRAGSATRSDTLRATVDLGNARIALLQARANLATAQADLGRQVGVAGPVRALPDSAFPALPDTTGLRAAALAGAPLVQEAVAEARAAGARVQAARSEYWPSFSASYSTAKSGSQVAPWTSLDPYVNNWSLRFSLSWTLFNGFTREANQVAASVQRENAEARAADARRAVQARLTQQLAALFTAYEQINISGATVAAATEDLRVQQERYRVGAATILDLLTSQASLTQAEVNLVQARFNALLARAEVEALVGYTL